MGHDQERGPGHAFFAVMRSGRASHSTSTPQRRQSETPCSHSNQLRVATACVAPNPTRRPCSTLDFQEDRSASRVSGIVESKRGPHVDGGNGRFIAPSIDAAKGSVSEGAGQSIWMDEHNQTGVSAVVRAPTTPSANPEPLARGYRRQRPRFVGLFGATRHRHTSPRGPGALGRFTLRSLTVRATRARARPA